MAKTTWTDKVALDPQTNRVNQWWAADANEIKASVNYLYDVIQGASSLRWKEIDDALVFKIESPTTPDAIEVGDIIKRYPTNTRYIHAIVNALPYTDDNNLLFFEDTQAL